MKKLSRRGFLKRSSIGVATTGVLGTALMTTPISGRLPDLPRAGAEQRQPVTATSGDEPLVVHVRDRAGGEVSVLIGTREVTYRDPGLVAHLLRVVR
jgi:hypothetical protein